MRGDAMDDAAREQPTEIEVAVNCYVVDGEKLVGVVPLRVVVDRRRRRRRSPTS